MAGRASADWWRRTRSHLLEWTLTGWPIAIIVGVYVVIDRAIRTVADLGAGYRKPVLLVELIVQNTAIAILAGGVTAAVVWRLRSLGPVWPSFERGWSLRCPVGVVIIVLTWAYAFYEYNLWADHLHAFDRLALIALAGLALWRPVFLAPWTVVVAMLAFQFRQPIGGDQLAETYQLVRVAELFIAVLVVRLVTARWYRSEFVLLAVALVASGYWVSGLGKLRLGWLAVGPHLDSLFFATYANGWLGFLSPSDASAWGRALGPLLWPLLIVGAVVELGAVAILWGRWTLRIWLVAFVAFHLGVFTLTGIFFWKWMVFEVTLLAFLGRDRLIDHLRIFDTRHAAIATVLIVGGPMWSRPIDLSWLDSPVSYVYRFEATHSDGTRDELPPAFFRPNDSLFTLSPFGYLSPEPRFPVVWGALRERDLLEELYAADSSSEIFAIEAEHGSVEFDADRAAALDEYLVEFVGAWNRRRSHVSVFSLLRAPPQLWTSGRQVGSGDIEAITVWQVTTYWDGDEYDEIQSVVVREVEIVSDPSGAAK